ncbi:MAG TPA: hypothetical protein VMU54_02885, partial [Planctomycetota bacterium]|nr:hypothetical protein [Planctomycetota bacterium]
MKIVSWTMLAFVFGLSTAALCQDDGRWSETQFHRVHLRNGNFVDGKVIRLSDKEVVLKLTPGELCLRMDLVDRIELIKMKSYSEKSIDIQKPVARPPGGDTKAPSPSSAPPAAVSTVKLSADVQEAIQGLLEEFDRGDVEMKQTVLTKMMKLDPS